MNRITVEARVIPASPKNSYAQMLPSYAGRLLASSSFYSYPFLPTSFPFPSLQPIFRRKVCDAPFGTPFLLFLIFVLFQLETKASPREQHYIHFVARAWTLFCLYSASIPLKPHHVSNLLIQLQAVCHSFNRRSSLSLQDAHLLASPSGFDQVSSRPI